jgi:hypothetical protein
VGTGRCHAFGAEGTTRTGTGRDLLREGGAGSEAQLLGQGEESPCVCTMDERLPKQAP